MKYKSKFVAFFLSIIPGVGQLYLGLHQRATLFFSLFFVAIFGTNALAVLMHNSQLLAVLMFILPLVWFLSMVDALNMVDRIRQIAMTNGIDANEALTRLNNIRAIEKENRRLVSIALSVIPGAGHMYVGLLNRGALIMGVFLGLMVLTNWLDIPMIGFLLPVIWFYGIFEAYHLQEKYKDNPLEDQPDILHWFGNNRKKVGWVLICLACLVLFVKIVNPLLVTYLNSQSVSYIQTALAAVILLGGGIKLIWNNDGNNDEEPSEPKDGISLPDPETH